MISLELIVCQCVRLPVVLEDRRSGHEVSSSSVLAGSVISLLASGGVSLWVGTRWASRGGTIQCLAGAGAMWTLWTLFCQGMAHARIVCLLQAAPLRSPKDHSWNGELVVCTALFLVPVARWAMSHRSSNRFSKVA